MSALPISNRDGLARNYGDETARAYALLEHSLDPRGPASLYEIAGGYLSPDSRILDAGCRDARHLIELVKRYGGTGVGVDPVEIHVERAREAIARENLEREVEVLHGVMQELPYPDGHFDFVWCRDVLEQVDDVEAALHETARVLSPQGRMLVYTVLATELLSDDERAMLERTLADVPSNLVERNIEEAFARAGLAVERKDVVGSEWREYEEERSQPASHALLQLSRLRRQRDSLVREVGLDVYEHVEAHLHWLIWMFLGKTLPTIYVVRHETADDSTAFAAPR